MQQVEQLRQVRPKEPRTTRTRALHHHKRALPSRTTLQAELAQRNDAISRARAEAGRFKEAAARLEQELVGERERAERSEARLCKVKKKGASLQGSPRWECACQAKTCARGCRSGRELVRCEWFVAPMRCCWLQNPQPQGPKP